MRKHSLAIVAICCAIGAFSIAADDKLAAKAPTPEQMAEMMQKYGTPGEEHSLLKSMEGTFDAEVTMQMTPDSPPMTSKGKMVNKLIFNGRFLQGEFSGDFMGQPFAGINVMGFDRMKKKYFSSWMDSMSTGLMNAEGDADTASKKITLSCTFDCPMDNAKHTQRQVLSIMDENSHLFEVYDKAPDAKEFKTMSIKYTRAK